MFGLAGTCRGPGRALVPSLGSGIMTGHRVRRKAQPDKAYSTAGWMDPDPLVLGHPPGWVRVRTQLDEINRYWLCCSSPQLTSIRADKCKGSSQTPQAAVPASSSDQRSMNSGLGRCCWSSDTHPAVLACAATSSWAFKAFSQRHTQTTAPPPGQQHKGTLT